MSPRQPRLMDSGFLTFLRKQPCCLCGIRQFVEAAHIRMGNITLGKPMTGMGRKPDDKYAVPLCAWEHRQAPDSQHNIGDELQFWKRHGINPFVVAAFYYQEYGGTGGKPAPRRKIKPRKLRHLRAKIQSRNTLRKAKP